MVLLHNYLLMLLSIEVRVADRRAQPSNATFLLSIALDAIERGRMHGCILRATIKM
jgi:hypothetical protein